MQGHTTNLIAILLKLQASEVSVTNQFPKSNPESIQVTTLG